MTTSSEMRKYINITNGSHVKEDDIPLEQSAFEWLADVSASVADNKVNEGLSSALGVTVAFISISLGGQEITTVGPMDMNGATDMKRTIQQDIVNAYKNDHPYGWTDGSGTIYRLKDWDVSIDTCHSSQCADRLGKK